MKVTLTPPLASRLGHHEKPERAHASSRRTTLFTSLARTKWKDTNDNGHPAADHGGGICRLF